MARRRADGSTPAWYALTALAAEQGGYFAASQARTHGVSYQLLEYAVRQGRFERERRGLYHLTHHPRDAHDDLILDWLWSERQGVASHETALSLYRLSDVLPRWRHLTVPASWQDRRLRVPRGLVLHHADLAPEDLDWSGVLRITRPLRTLQDCRVAGLSPDLLDAAVQEAVARGLLGSAEAARVLQVKATA